VIPPSVTNVTTRRAWISSLVVAAITGALFGAGLLISGMTQPARVIGFLDVTRGWDPSLAFVMAGAVGVYALAWRGVRSRRGPWFDGSFHLPARSRIDRPLIVGAALFGVGWGLAGVCPGPGIVSAAAGSSSAVVFVLAMLAGMLAQHRWIR
jgi:uncharacterized membrane protein YedE/YeeE